jgi:hypothetical protein
MPRLLCGLEKGDIVGGTYEENETGWLFNH